MKENKFRQRSLLYIQHNCMPKTPPVWTTLVSFILLVYVDMHWIFQLSLIGMLLLFWFAYIAQAVYGMPVDIFEYFRKEDNTTELPIEP